MRLIRHILLSKNPLNSVLVPANQVQQGEQENPHNIDKVPVQAAQFNRRVIGWAKLSAFGAQCQPCQQSQPNHHVEGVQAGHGKVEGEENLRLLGCLLGGNFSDVWIAVVLGIADFLGDITQ